MGALREAGARAELRGRAHRHERRQPRALPTEISAGRQRAVARGFLRLARVAVGLVGVAWVGSTTRSRIAHAELENRGTWMAPARARGHPTPARSSHPRRRRAGAPRLWTPSPEPKHPTPANSHVDSALSTAPPGHARRGHVAPTTARIDSGVSGTRPASSSRNRRRTAPSPTRPSARPPRRT